MKYGGVLVLTPSQPPPAEELRNWLSSSDDTEDYPYERTPSTQPEDEEYDRVAPPTKQNDQSLMRPSKLRIGYLPYFHTPI